MTDLDTLGGPASAALAINTAGKIVGTSLTGFAVQHAFYWSAGIMTDLNDVIGTTDWKLEAATSVNDLGYIVGVGTLLGVKRGFLLKPVQPLSVGLSPAKVAGCLHSTGKVTLNVPAPADTVVSLSETHPNATVPPTVTVPKGATFATFTINTTAVTPIRPVSSKQPTAELRNPRP